MRIATPRTSGSWRSYYPAQRRLRLELAFAGASGGGVWGCIALTLAHDPGTSLVLGGLRGDAAASAPASLSPAAALVYVLAALVAVPVGALVGAMPLDLLSHALGRRPAVMVCALLVSTGSLIGAVSAGWGQVVAAVLAGLGVGGYAIVTPKLAHELAQRGHTRLIPRLAALAPAGAGVALLAGEAGGLLAPRETPVCAWLAPMLASLAVFLLAMGLPETPHWYAARGNVEAAHAALQRMTDPLEAAVGIDWVMMDAGMLGEQRPLSSADLRVDRLRRTIRVGAFLEMVQVLPFGIAAICLAPALLVLAGGGLGQGAALAAGTALPAWSALTLALGWTAVAVVSRWRRPERMLLAWIMAGIGIAVMALVCLAGVLASGARGVGLVQVVLVVVAVLLVAAQYLCVAPACLGGTDPLVPPWLLRSQRRAQAVARPLVQIAAVGLPVALLAAGVSAAVTLGVCLAVQLVGMLVVLAGMPRLAAALR